ncbi:hypothetical protein Mgra_00010259 [Meloidogyne graminicola]|uniref:Uncharacterized protein n=1 Tax=Meloidogyne graminicola TaxID=189291 RepID=A0A8S9Z7A6_9BILA|nr:hypothetical protein Mgra_00010259 [Meloidogyne graminicola]
MSTSKPMSMSIPILCLFQSYAYVYSKPMPTRIHDLRQPIPFKNINLLNANLHSIQWPRVDSKSQYLLKVLDDDADVQRIWKNHYQQQLYCKGIRYFCLLEKFKKLILQITIVLKIFAFT